MSKKLKTKKKKTSVTQFEKEFFRAINYRINQLERMAILEISLEYEHRLNELEGLKQYMKECV